MTATTQQTLWDAVAYLTPDPTSHGTISLRSDRAREAVSAIAAHIASIEAERDAEKLKSMPHMCRDEHAEIRHGLSDDDDRCPVCRERDRALAAEDQIAEIREKCSEEVRDANYRAYNSEEDECDALGRAEDAEAEVARLTAVLDRIGKLSPEPDDKVWYDNTPGAPEPVAYRCIDHNGRIYETSVGDGHSADMDHFGCERGLHTAAVIARTAIRQKDADHA